jgi:hypothetical protein
VLAATFTMTRTRCIVLRAPPEELRGILFHES